MKTKNKWRQTIAVGKFLALAAVLVFTTGGSTVAAQSASNNRAQRFAAAAKEFGVPEEILLSVSYNQSRWISHGTEASVDGGFGLMNLRSKAAVKAQDGRGDASRTQNNQADNAQYTLDEAASLLNASTESLKSDESQNIRGAAAILADYARKQNNGSLPGSIDGWYGAVAQYSGSTYVESAQSFADDTFANIEQGIAETTEDGQKIDLKSRGNLKPNHKDLDKLNLPSSPALAQVQSSDVECPAGLNCRFVPAAYTSNGGNPYDFGNYDTANRPQDMKIKYIIIHDTEGSYQSAIDWFQNPASYVSCNYVIRSSDGEVTQMVHNNDVQWCAGDWYVNTHSINIEHEGYASQGGTWYTEAMYRSSAKLVRYLAKKYNIPVDRQHILGHDNLPTVSPSRMASQHTDPGPYWDWNHYMKLIKGGNASGPRVTQHTKTLTISPKFATNQPAIQDCSSGTCIDLPAQGSNLVYLHTEPNSSSPLLSDPYVHTDGSAGTNEISDWSAIAANGSEYAVAGKQGDWTGIWYGGQIGWFYNPNGSGRTAFASRSKLVTPKAGNASVPVYGVAYPEASAYPATIPVQTPAPLYEIPAGQFYATSGKVITDYYYSMTVDDSIPDDHTVVSGDEVYYQITFNHKQVYVKAADVDIR